MAKKTDNRNDIIMRCTECGYELRPTSKNRKNTTERLEIKKFCPKCRKQVVAKEKK